MHFHFYVFLKGIIVISMMVTHNSVNKNMYIVLWMLITC